MERLIIELSGHINTWTYLSMASWLLMNTCLANINKLLFMNFAFPYPLLITALHMLCTAVFGFVVIRYTSFGAAYGDADKRLDLPQPLRPKIFILSVISTVSIACGNIALKYLYISFFKMILAMTPLATVFISRFVGGVHYDQFAYMSMVPLSFGAVLCTMGEVNFSVFGFIAATTATFLRAGKCVMQGVLLKEERIDSVRLLYYICIPSFLQLAVASTLFEGDALWDARLHSSGFLWLLIVLSCACAVGYNFMTFMVTFYTSPVTLQVLNNVSVVLTVAMSILIFQNEVSTMSKLGSAFILLGTVLYQNDDIPRRFYRRIVRYYGKAS